MSRRKLHNKYTFYSVYYFIEHKNVIVNNIDIFIRTIILFRFDYDDIIITTVTTETETAVNVNITNEQITWYLIFKLPKRAHNTSAIVFPGKNYKLFLVIF